MNRQLKMAMVRLGVGIFLLSSCGGSPMGPNQPGNNQPGNNQPGQNNPGNNNPSGQGSGPMTAVVDGQAWAAHPISVTAATLPSIPGGFLVTGTESDGSHSKSINISLANVRGPGTYALGVSFSVVGGSAQYGDLNGAWRTPDNGAAGKVTLTTLSATRIAGTFEYTAVPGHRNTAMGTRVITQGRFDLPLRTPNNMLPAVPDGAGSRVTATIGGQTYTAANVLPYHQGNNLNLNTYNDDRDVSILLEGVTGPGTYGIDMMAPIVRHIVVSDKVPGVQGRRIWGSGNMTTTGSITITSLTATRVQGTFQGSLGPQRNTPATEQLEVSGDFDIGLQ